MFTPYVVYMMKLLTRAKQADIPPLIALCCFHLACSVEIIQTKI